MPKTAEYFHCELCVFNCSKQSNYNAHLLTRKHKMLTNVDNKMPKNAEFVCDDCGKLYKYRQSLHVHKRKCSVSKDSITVKDNNNSLVVTDKPDYKDLLMQAMKQMQEQHEEIKKKDELMAQMIDKIGNTTNNTMNNQFNINMFLNETCKNAMNLSDFIDRIEISHDDLENNAQLGFVNGMTKILMDNLRHLTLHERPIHCTDVKRETLYVKDEDVWDKEKSTVKLENAIQEVSRKSLKSLINWKKMNPDYEDLDSEFSKKSIHIQQNSSGLCQKESFYPKIIHHLAKENSITHLKSDL
tara:strand:- start:7757 stop:8653 length:897 start_codon:yes stop_codon:yes gene_type:complete